MGAGVLPFSVSNGKVQFLFQKVFDGRKAGFFIDFGGGLSEGEDYVQAAIREFVEETETLYFSPDLETAHRTPERVAEQLPIVQHRFDKTLSEHPNWWCYRATPAHKKPKDWRTYFIEFEHRDLDAINREWASDESGRFKKRRELHWLSSDALLEICAQSPEKLWKRVRELAGLERTIRSIAEERTDGQILDR